MANLIASENRKRILSSLNMGTAVDFRYAVMSTIWIKLRNLSFAIRFVAMKVKKIVGTDKLAAPPRTGSCLRLGQKEMANVKEKKAFGEGVEPNED